MKKLILMLLTSFSLMAYGQYNTTEETFSKTYTQLRIWEKPDSTWVYSDGTFTDWTFIFNVEFFSFPGGSNMFGTVMENSKGEPKFFCNYLGDLYESEDEYGEYGSYKVDILSKNDDTGTWGYWNSGELRYYGPWTYLFTGDKMYFSYFNQK
jgi:hypothetical protein